MSLCVWTLNTTYNKFLKYSIFIYFLRIKITSPFGLFYLFFFFPSWQYWGLNLGPRTFYQATHELFHSTYLSAHHSVHWRRYSSCTWIKRLPMCSSPAPGNHCASLCFCRCPGASPLLCLLWLTARQTDGTIRWACVGSGDDAHTSIKHVGVEFYLQNECLLFPKEEGCICSAALFSLELMRRICIVTTVSPSLKR